MSLTRISRTGESQVTPPAAVPDHLSAHPNQEAQRA